MLRALATFLNRPATPIARRRYEGAGAGRRWDRLVPGVSPVADTLAPLSDQLKAYLDSPKLKRRASQLLQCINAGEQIRQHEMAAALGLSWSDFTKVFCRGLAVAADGAPVRVFDEQNRLVETITARRASDA